LPMEHGKRILLQGEDIQRTIIRMAHEVSEKGGAIEEIALIGIRSRGAYLAKRLARNLERLEGTAPPIGVIDVTPYRDDRSRGEIPASFLPTEVPVSVDEKTVVLIDDVIYTGRTIRAALDRLAHLGKPKKILLAILVDRGDRELPIKADIVGKNVRVKDSERVNVLLQESDGVDQVTVTKNP
jgi:pyrimidine operon attenuation protein/uracil phosphoribosyltransferase